MKYDLPHYHRLFVAQRNLARHRGIEFKLEFDDWVKWWGDDIDSRGRGKNDLQMQRFGDKGAYEIGNIKKGRPADNAKTRENVQKHRRALEAKKRHEQQLDDLIYAPSREVESRNERTECIMKTNGAINRKVFMADKSR